MPLSQGGGGGGGGSSSPGFEISYTQITAPINIVSTTESSGTVILSPGAITFDGSPVLVHLFAPVLVTDSAAVGDFAVLSLFEGATQICRMIINEAPITVTPYQLTGNAFLRFTPTAASHTYTVTAFASSTTGTPKVTAGTGGAGAYPAAFIRFTKV